MFFSWPLLGLVLCERTRPNKNPRISNNTGRKAIPLSTGSQIPTTVRSATFQVNSSAKRVQNESRVLQPTATSKTFSRSGAERMVTAGCGLTPNKTPEKRQTEKEPLNYVGVDCSPNFFYKKGSNEINLVIVVYIRSSQEYGELFAELSERISTNILIHNVGFCVYDLSCNESVQPANFFVDVILNETLNNHAPFKIQATIADLTISDLTSLLNIMSPFSVPIFFFTSGETSAGELTKKYQNTVPMFYGYGFNILIKFLSNFQITPITTVYDLGDDSREIMDGVIKRIAYFYPHLCVFSKYRIGTNYNTVTVLNQIDQDLYSNFVLIISKNISLVTMIINGVTAKKLCYVFYSFEEIFDEFHTKTQFVTVSGVNSGTSSNQRGSLGPYKGHVFLNFFTLLKDNKNHFEEFGSKTFKNDNKREFPVGTSNKIVQLGKEDYDVSDGHVALYHVQLADSEVISMLIGVYCFRSEIAVWHDWIPFNYSSSCKRANCSAGFYPVFVAQKCCWNCYPCAEGYVKESQGQQLCSKCDLASSLPNFNNTQCIFYQYKNYKIDYAKVKTALILTTLGAAYTSSYLIIFIIFKDTILIKSSNFQLSVTQLILHACLNLQLIETVLEQKKLVCHIHMLVWGYLLKGIISIYIIKINQLLAIFNSQVHIHRTKLATFQEIVAPCTYVIFNLIITLYIQIARGEYAIYVNKKQFVKYHFCYHQTSLYFEILSVIILSMVAAIKAFVARKLPNNFNETSYIFLGMFTNNILLLLMIPLDASWNSDGRVVFADSLMIFSINSVTLTITYGYKIYILLFCKEKNQKEHFQRQTFQMLERNVAKNFWK